MCLRPLAPYPPPPIGAASLRFGRPADVENGEPCSPSRPWHLQILVGGKSRGLLLAGSGGDSALSRVGYCARPHSPSVADDDEGGSVRVCGASWHPAARGRGGGRAGREVMALLFFYIYTSVVVVAGRLPRVLGFGTVCFALCHEAVAMPVTQYLFRGLPSSDSSTGSPS